MDLTRTAAAWLIAVIGALFAFVTYVQALREYNAGVIMAIIGICTMGLLWYLAKDSENDDTHLPFQYPLAYRKGDQIDELTISHCPQPIRRRQFRDNR